MPTKYATQPHWRTRRQAIGRKGGYEAEMVFESEALVVKSKPDIPPNSPVRIDSVFHMPEIKPLVLPDAWTTVGKGGRPLRGEQKMYDEPQKTKKKKTRKAKKADQEASLADYEEMPSSSDCLVALSRSLLKHEKAVERKHQVKHWAKYRQEKAMKTLARDDLIAMLAAEGALGDADGTKSLSTSHGGPIPKQWQLNRNNRAERTRRKVRLARAAERCYFEPDDHAADGFVAKRATWPAASPSTEKSAVGSAAAKRAREDTKVKAPANAALARSETPRDATGKKGRRKQAAGKSSAKNCVVM